MVLIVQRSRIRARRRSPSLGQAAFSIVIAGRSALVDSAPALGRSLERRLSAHRRLIIAATVPLALVAALGLHAIGPAERVGTASPGSAAATGQLNVLAGADIEPSDSPSTAHYPAVGRGVPGLGFPAVGTAAPEGNAPLLVSAVLAADLWQAANAVYQAKTLGPTEAAGTPPSRPETVFGPSLNDLLAAQVRLATAMLTVQSLQGATDSQIAAARQAVAEAEAQIELSRRLLQSVNVAPPAKPDDPAAEDSPGARAARLAAAQQDVANAEAALAAAEHPYSDEQIAQAQADLLNAQQALAAAVASSSPSATTKAPSMPQTPPAPIQVQPAGTVANEAPHPAPSVQPRPAAPPTGPAAAATAGPTLPPSTDADRAPSAGTVAVAPTANPGVQAVQSRQGAGDSGILQGGVQSPALATAAPAPTSAVAPARTATAIPTASAPATTSAASSPAPAQKQDAGRVAAPTGVAAPASAPAAPAAAAPARPRERLAHAATAAASGADIAALEQQVALAQQKLDLYSAPPDPTAVQNAQGDLAAAQQRLAALLPAATEPAGGDSSLAADLKSAADPAAAATPPALQIQRSLSQAEGRYSRSVQWLAAVSNGPDPATVQVAEDELRAAESAFADLLARADASVKAQIDPDPRSALPRIADAPELVAAYPDLRAFIWPARGPITSYFGPGHPLGIDIAQGLGLPVTAAASGVVSFSGGDPCCSYGYYIDVTHPGGYTTRYGHLLMRSFLKPGDRVRQGQIIGISGSTGFSTGPHLHFEIRLNGVPLDPLRLLAGLPPLLRSAP